MMKKLMVCVACFVLALSLAACGGKGSNSAVSGLVGGDPSTWGSPLDTETEDVQIPNPWQTCDSLEEAGELAGFSFTVPDALDRYGNAILRCAYSYLHNMADAEEILQDTLLKLLTADPSFESEEHKKAWLLRTAANLSKNRIEYNALRVSDELSDELAEEGREDLSFVWDAVKDLPVQFREVIHLHYYEGYSTEEIARLLDRNPSTVRSDLLGQSGGNPIFRPSRQRLLPEIHWNGGQFRGLQ